MRPKMSQKEIPSIETFLYRQPWSTRLPFNVNSKIAWTFWRPSGTRYKTGCPQRDSVYYARFTELCSVVQCDITSAFVVRKFFRKLYPTLQTQLMIHYGGRVKLEAASLRDIYSMKQQFEAAVLQQSKADYANRQQQTLQYVRVVFI